MQVSIKYLSSSWATCCLNFVNVALVKIELMGYIFFPQPRDDVMNSYQISHECIGLTCYT